MATYYKVTNVTGGTEKGPRGIFLTEAGKLIKPGQSAFNVRRLNPETFARNGKDLDIEESSKPFKDLSDKPVGGGQAVGPKPVKHKIIEAPDGVVAKPPPDPEPEKAPDPEPEKAADPEPEKADAEIDEPEQAPDPELKAGTASATTEELSTSAKPKRGSKKKRKGSSSSD